MNRNRKLRKQMMSGLAVGMAAVMGAAPVYAATGEDAAVSKEETVYVNANADGSEDQITVSNWLKNAGTEKNLQDESELKDIKNVKGDEEFTQSGNKLTWQTDGEDIYYQGTTTKEPPVSVKFTYYLDGKEIKPDDLAGKSGKLKIKVDYTNNTKTGQNSTNVQTDYSEYLNNGWAFKLVLTKENQIAGNYSAEMTWTLADAPTE